MAINKLLEENIGRTLCDMNHIQILFYALPRVMKIKTKINKLDLVIRTSFCTAEETTDKRKRQHSKWEKIFAIKATNKGLNSQLQKLIIKLIIKKKKLKNFRPN